MKRLFGKTLIALMATSMAMPAQANWGMGMYGAMQMCPFPFGAAGGASNGNDVLDELRRDRRELQKDIRELQNKIDNAEDKKDKYRERLEEALHSQKVTDIIAHMENGWNCCSTGGTTRYTGSYEALVNLQEALALINEPEPQNEFDLDEMNPDYQTADVPRAKVASTQSTSRGPASAARGPAGETKGTEPIAKTPGSTLKPATPVDPDDVGSLPPVVKQPPVVQKPPVVQVPTFPVIAPPAEPTVPAEPMPATPAPTKAACEQNTTGPNSHWDIPDVNCPDYRPQLNCIPEQLRTSGFMSICMDDGGINPAVCMPPYAKPGLSREVYRQCRDALTQYQKIIKNINKWQKQLTKKEEKLDKIEDRILREKDRDDDDMESDCEECARSGGFKVSRPKWYETVAAVGIDALGMYLGNSIQKRNQRMGYPQYGYAAGGLGFPYATASLYGSMYGGMNGGFGCSPGIGGMGPMGMMGPFGMGGGVGMPWANPYAMGGMSPYGMMGPGGMFMPGMSPYGMMGMPGMGMGAGIGFGAGFGMPGMGGFPGMGMGMGGFPGMGIGGGFGMPGMGMGMPGMGMGGGFGMPGMGMGGGFGMPGMGMNPYGMPGMGMGLPGMGMDSNYYMQMQQIQMQAYQRYQENYAARMRIQTGLMSEYQSLMMRFNQLNSGYDSGMGFGGGFGGGFGVGGGFGGSIGGGIGGGINTGTGIPSTPSR